MMILHRSTTSASPGSLWEMQTDLEVTPKLLSQILHFIRAPERFIYKFEEHLHTLVCKLLLFSEVIRIKLILDNQNKWT